MKKAFTRGIHIHPIAVRAVAGLFGGVTLGMLAAQWPGILRYLKSRSM